MLSPVHAGVQGVVPTVAHAGLPLAPHDLWTAWSADPLVVVGLALALLAHRRGRRPHDVVRTRCFLAGLAVVAVAVLTPLDALSGSLASAHMVQHVLLVLVAAPLLAISAPSSALLRGSPVAVRREIGRWRRRLHVAPTVGRALRHPVTVWLLHVVTLWLWHARVLYDAALTDAGVHALEHATFLLTAVLFWRVVVGSRRGVAVPAGLGVLLVFGAAMQSVLLSLLLVFANEPFYAGYANTTQAWGLEPLLDQQLAGAIMWVPAGLVYLGAALVLLVAWIGGADDEAPAPLVARRVAPERG